MIDQNKRAVLFDMWGTLLYEQYGYDTEEPLSFLNQLAEKLDVSLAALKHACFLTAQDAYLGRLDVMARMRCIVAHLGLSLTETTLRALSEFEMTYRDASVLFYSTTLSTLREVRQRGYKIGLLTDCPWIFPPIVERLQLTRYVDAMALSCQEGMTKANPAFFLLLTEQLEVRPQACVYVGDGASHEMAMSKQLGMTPVVIEQIYAYCRTNRVEGYDHRISSLHELLAILPQRESNAQLGRE